MRIFCIFIFPFIFALSSVQGEWEIILEESGDINSMDFVGDSLGWIAGSQGLLYKTLDGGETWIKINMDQSLSIEQLDFVNRETGWIHAVNRIGDISYTEVYRSENGGLTWSNKLSYNYDDYWFSAIYPVNDSCLYIIADYTLLLKTHDGGDHWQEMTYWNEYQEIYSIWFFSETDFIATGRKRINDTTFVGLVMSTEDGGLNWQEKILADLSIINFIQFLDDSTGFFTGSIHDNQHILYKTSNRFNSWSEIIHFTPGMWHSVDPPLCHFLNKREGIIINETNLLKTGDGGASWDTLSTLDSWRIQAANFNNNNTGHIASRLGISGWGPWTGSALLRTIDGGYDWNIRKIFAYNYNDVSILDEEKIYIAGGYRGPHYSDGDIFITDSAFQSWDQNLHAREIEVCDFTNELFGLALGISNFGLYHDVYFTEDGGRNWEARFENNLWNESSDVQFYVSNIIAISENRAWLLGHSHAAAVLETNDWGETWEILWQYNDGEDGEWFADACMINDTLFWAVGYPGFIAKHTGNNEWQVMDISTDLPLHKVCFADESLGWISGGYQDRHEFQTVLLHTIDAGETWVTVTPFDYLIYDIYFRSANHGWFAGCDSSGKGILLETTDGGNSFNVVVNDLPVFLLAIDFKDDLGIVVGGGYFDWLERLPGIILRTTNGGITWVGEKRRKTYPTKFELSQNYPNPFNPKTVIGYSLPVNCDVELYAFNMLGQKVSTLVNKHQNAGNYEVNFNAKHLPSGIYFYQLKAGEKIIETKKMILMR